jgi:hypothetical protein
MWSAVLLLCMSEGLCQAQIDPIVRPTKDLCEMSVQIGAEHFYKQGWKISDFRCIQWDKEEDGI